jgi:hypothetical protein
MKTSELPSTDFYVRPNALTSYYIDVLGEVATGLMTDFES